MDDEATLNRRNYRTSPYFHFYFDIIVLPPCFDDVYNLLHHRTRRKCIIVAIMTKWTILQIFCFIGSANNLRYLFLLLPQRLVMFG